MPELPEVETTRRGISPHIENHNVSQVIVREAKLRWPIPVHLNKTLKNQKLTGIKRRAKYLLLEFNHGTLLIHLGMSGSLRILESKTEAMAHDHFDLVFGKVTLRLRDPRKFGAVIWTDKPWEQHKLIAHLGPEPLSDKFNTEYLFTKSHKRNTTIKQLIMDAKVVVGVGNIYASESLYLAGINPKRKAGSISKKRINNLAGAIKQVLSKAIKAGGTILKDFTRQDGKPGYFAHSLQVYGRTGEACFKCSAPIQQITLGQRSTFYCPRCQKQ